MRMKASVRLVWTGVENVLVVVEVRKVWATFSMYLFWVMVSVPSVRLRAISMLMKVRDSPSRLTLKVLEKEASPEDFVESSTGGGVGVKAEDVVYVDGELYSGAINCFPVDVRLDHGACVAEVGDEFS